MFLRKHECEAQLAIASQGVRETREPLRRVEIRGMPNPFHGTAGIWGDEDDSASTFAPSEFSEASIDFQLHDIETACEGEVRKCAWHDCVVWLQVCVAELCVNYFCAMIFALHVTILGRIRQWNGARTL